jgi:hypothetical protein
VDVCACSLTWYVRIAGAPPLNLTFFIKIGSAQKTNINNQQKENRFNIHRFNLFKCLFNLFYLIVLNWYWLVFALHPLPCP